MSQTQPPDGLEAHVRQAVDPIPASPRRKRAMREELLAHLIGAFEQELTSTGDPTTAAGAARKRFGNLETIRDELRQSVPLFERLIFIHFSLLEPPMLKWILVGIACVAVGMSVVLPALAKLKAGEKFTTEAGVLLSVGALLVLLGLWTIGYKIARRLMRSQPVSPR
jgi:hypothetical protein